jgi:hypothetical protein
MVSICSVRELNQLFAVVVCMLLSELVGARVRCHTNSCVLDPPPPQRTPFA